MVSISLGEEVLVGNPHRDARPVESLRTMAAEAMWTSLIDDPSTMDTESPRLTALSNCPGEVKELIVHAMNTEEHIGKPRRSIMNVIMALLNGHSWPTTLKFPVTSAELEDLATHIASAHTALPDNHPRLRLDVSGVRFLTHRQLARVLNAFSRDLLSGLVLGEQSLDIGLCFELCRDTALSLRSLDLSVDQPGTRLVYQGGLHRTSAWSHERFLERHPKDNARIITPYTLRHCAALEELNVRGCHLEDGVVQAVIQGSPRLHSLKVSHVFIEDQIDAVSVDRSFIERLRVLHIYQSVITTELLATLSYATNLTDLEIPRNVFGIAPDSLTPGEFQRRFADIKEHCPHLNKIDITGWEPKRPVLDSYGRVR